MLWIINYLKNNRIQNIIFRSTIISKNRENKRRWIRFSKEKLELTEEEIQVLVAPSNHPSIKLIVNSQVVFQFPSRQCVAHDGPC